MAKEKKETTPPAKNRDSDGVGYNSMDEVKAFYAKAREEKSKDRK